MSKKRLMNALAGAGMGYMTGKMYEDKQGTSKVKPEADRLDAPAPVTVAKITENAAPALAAEPGDTSNRKGSVETGTGRAKTPKAATLLAPPTTTVSAMPTTAPTSYANVDAFKAEGAPPTRSMFQNTSQSGVRNPATAAILRRREREQQEALDANGPRGYAVDPMLRKADGGVVKGYADGGKVNSIPAGCSPRSFPKKGK